MVQFNYIKNIKTKLQIITINNNQIFKHILVFVLFTRVLFFNTALCQDKYTEAAPMTCGASSNLDDARTIAFIKQFQAVIKHEDKRAVAKLMHYPLRIDRRTSNFKIKSYYIKNEKEFIESYDKLITSKMKKIILQQAPANLFCRTDGGMIGHGTIWFNNYGSIKADVIYIVNDQGE